MSEIIIQGMAAIQLPQDILQQVDVHNLLDNFRTNFKKLDDFKRIRDKHESRSAGKKIWDWIRRDNTIETAQLDAVEVQADFSKAIGQLMVLSVMQSQHLERQQKQLSNQQNIIKAQTTSIELHNETLEKQHEALAKQNVDLENLVNNFFELRGLTQEGAKKLIAIAHEVKDTRDQLLQSVDNSLSDTLRQIGATEEKIKAELVNTMKLVNSTISSAQSEIDIKLKDQLDEVSGQIALSNEKVSSIQDDLKLAAVEFEKRYEHVGAELVSLKEQHHVQLKSVITTLDVHAGQAEQFEKSQTSQDEELTEIRANLESEHVFSVGMDQKLNAMSEQFSIYHSGVQHKFRRLHILLGASAIFSVVLLGIVLYRL